MPGILRIDVVIPRFEIRVENAREVVRAMAENHLRRTRKRLERGESHAGPLPVPKDGGRPLNRSGQLINSLGIQLKGSAERPFAEILPQGKREDADDRGKRRRAGLARRRRSLSTRLRASGMDARDARRAATARIKASRAASRNMDVAAILANEPKDQRSINGDRERYWILGKSDEDERILAEIAASLARFALVEPSGARHRGQGDTRRVRSRRRRR